MGCIRSRPAPVPSELTMEGQVSTLSYSQHLEKVPNSAVRSQATWVRRKTVEKPHHRNRLTPSNMNHNLWTQDSDSLTGSATSIDILALTDTEKHWNFPKWGHSGTCTFCGCACHERVVKNMEKNFAGERNNLRFSLLDADMPVCPMSLSHLLAMVSYQWG